MYHMSESEFVQYEMAERRLHDLRKKHAIELQQAYDNIHPTRTCFDYQTGTLYWESVNPEKYAIYLIELREEHERMEKWWELRASAYREALELLTEEERNYISPYEYGNYQKRQNVRKKFRQILTEIVSTRPELQRQSVSLDEIEDLEEADRRIENMSMEELMEDYWDLDEQINEERLKERCIRLYETYDMTYLEIGRLLGIRTSRVKKYVGHKRAANS